MFVTFEGIEGSGKTTLQRLVGDSLMALGLPVVLTREPGGTALGAQLREILLGHATDWLSPRAELHLFLADRSQHIGELIRPALAKGFFVLCDRYADSTLAYQGFGRQLNLFENSEEIYCGLMPDLTFLIDVDPKIGLARAAARDSKLDGPDRIESESLEFHKRVRLGFFEIASRFPERIIILNGNTPPEQLCKECLKNIKAKSFSRGGLQGMLTTGDL